ncbi:hypothetical protein C8R44DRAFT_895383 [Mycena epipterygia]|nr:hypothetical protein C8R44DRAFT_895383 [Mycena epipterygia]
MRGLLIATSAYARTPPHWISTECPQILTLATATFAVLDISSPPRHSLPRRGPSSFRSSRPNHRYGLILTPCASASVLIAECCERYDNHPSMSAPREGRELQDHKRGRVDVEDCPPDALALAALAVLATSLGNTISAHTSLIAHPSVSLQNLHPLEIGTDPPIVDGACITVPSRLQPKRRTDDARAARDAFRSRVVTRACFLHCPRLARRCIWRHSPRESGLPVPLDVLANARSVLERSFFSALASSNPIDS